jgi:MFS transporter, DHA1 family, inner membrane transport protein
MLDSAAPRSVPVVLWLLLFGNMVIGTGVLLPAGLLNAIAQDFQVDVTTVGLLLLVGGVVVGFGAPLMAALTSGIDRRKILCFALCVFAAGHFVSIYVTNFWLLVVVRAVMLVGAAIFSPQAAATVGLLVPPEKRAGTIAFIFIGWSVASVAGIPLGSLIGAQFGWQTAYGLAGGLALIGAMGLWFTLADGLRVAPLNAAAWKTALTSPVVLVVLLVTLFSMAGQFTVFNYLAPILRQAYYATPVDIAVAFAVAGMAGVIGNSLASRLVSFWPVDRVIALALGCLGIGLLIYALGFGNYTVAVIGMGLWGLGTFSSNSLQQSRLVGLAPELASATVALNTSVVFFGQAMGAGLGGVMIKQGVSATSGYVAVGLIVLALSVSLIASRLMQTPRR